MKWKFATMKRVFSDFISILNGDGDPGGLVSILKNNAYVFLILEQSIAKTSPSSETSFASITVGKALALVQWSLTLKE